MGLGQSPLGLESSLRPPKKIFRSNLEKLVAVKKYLDQSRDGLFYNAGQKYALVRSRDATRTRPIQTRRITNLLNRTRRINNSLNERTCHTIELIDEFVI